MEEITFKADLGLYNYYRSIGYRTVWVGDGQIKMRKLC